MRRACVVAGHRSTNWTQGTDSNRAIEQLTVALADRYRIERELGAGGMATVYLATDVKHERQVALIVLRAELAQALGPERFLREIKIAARLDHPHLLALHDSGEADGFLYYVMPFVETTARFVPSRRRRRREGRRESLRRVISPAYSASDSSTAVRHRMRYCWTRLQTPIAAGRSSGTVTRLARSRLT